MTIEWVTPHWIWSLIPLILIWWWLRRNRRSSYLSQNVASIQLWQRLKGVESPGQRWITILPVLILGLLAGGPRIVDSPQQQHAWTRSLTGDLRLDWDSPDPVDEIQLHFQDGEIRSLDFETVESRTSVWIPRSSAAPSLLIRSKDGDYPIAIPASDRQTRVRYLGESTSMQLLLNALELEGWIKTVGTDDSAEADIVIGPYPSLSSSSDSPTSSSVPQISFITEGQTVFLPMIESPKPGEPLFQGLEPVSWTVTSAFAVPEGRPVLQSTEGQPLISRTANGFVWGFQPEAGDLGERSDWPLVMIRMLTELSISNIEDRSLSSWALLQISLVIAALGSLTLWALTGTSSWPCLLLILTAIFVGNRSTEMPWSDLTMEPVSANLAASLPSGSRIVFQESDPVPPPEWLRSLAARGLGWTVERSTTAATSSGRWTLTNRVVDPGTSVEVLGIIPAGEWILTSPDGTDEKLQFPIRKRQPGLWTVAAPNGRKDAFLIRNPIPVTSACSEGATLESLFEDPRFRVSPLGMKENLPRPAAGNILAWQGEALPEKILEKLPSWIEAGGFLFAASGDQDCEDSRTLEVLEDVLGAPLSPMEDQDVDMGVILLDLSGSLIGESATTLLESTLAILETSIVGLRWGVAGFRTEVDWLLEPGTRIDSGTAGLLASEILSGGGTRLGHALQQLTPRLKQHDGSKRLLVLTDGRTVPANWSQIGQELSAAGIELEILLVGTAVDRTAAEELIRSAGGSLDWASSTSEALTLISAWIPQDLPGWVRPTPPLVQNEASPLVSGFSLPNSIPDQILSAGEIDLDRHTATRIWEDSSGKMILSSQPNGKGQALMWWSSFAASRLGDSSAALIDRLRDMVATSAGRKRYREMACCLLRNLNGTSRLAVKREFRDLASLGQVGIFGDSPPVDLPRLLSAKGDEYFQSQLPALRETVYWTTETRSGIAKELNWSEIETCPWLGIPADQSPVTGGEPWPPLLILAAFLWISSPVRQR